ncbi:hypothetical protein HDU96_004987 [Phlyctochytrium bullatum]|nr:hypothetical protein HDU96_004987 [Phlyctochytrium bullatum]
MESIQAVAETVTALPKVVVFDLDCTLWSPWIDATYGPPFREDRTNYRRLYDSGGGSLRLCNDIAEVLNTLRDKGIILAIASRTAAIEWAQQALRQFKIPNSENELTPMSSFFLPQAIQIFPGDKQTHFKNISEATGAEYLEMLFFDDERRNISSVSKLGVTAVLVEERTGVTRQSVIDGLRDFNESPKTEERSWAAAAISHLVLDIETRTELVKGGVVSALVKAVKAESHLGIIVELLGSIRNLINASDGDDVALELINLDCAQLAIKVVTFITSNKTPANEAEAETLKHKLDMSEQVLNILWSLAEVSLDVVQLVSTDEMVSLLFMLLEPNEKLPHSLLQCSAQILNTITDDNESFNEKLKQRVSGGSILHRISSAAGSPFDQWDDLIQGLLVSLGAVQFALEFLTNLFTEDLNKSADQWEDVSDEGAMENDDVAFMEEDKGKPSAFLHETLSYLDANQIVAKQASDEHLSALTTLYTASDSSKIFCIGTLSVLGKSPGNIPQNQKVGNFLLSILEGDEPLAAVAEALNGIFDIYADKEFDYDLPVFVNGNFLARLKAVYGKIRGKAAQLSKKKERALHQRVFEALENLEAFIQYKATE